MAETVLRLDWLHHSMSPGSSKLSFTELLVVRAVWKADILTRELPCHLTCFLGQWQNTPVSKEIVLYSAECHVIQMTQEYVVWVWWDLKTYNSTVIIVIRSFPCRWHILESREDFICQFLLLGDLKWQLQSYLVNLC